MALANDRLVSPAAGLVGLRWKDHAQGNRPKTMGLPAAEFLAGLLHHMPPDGFDRVRHFGLLANRGRRPRLARCRALLTARSPEPAPTQETVGTLRLRVTGVDIARCPACRVGRLHVVGRLLPGALPAPSVRHVMKRSGDPCGSP